MSEASSPQGLGLWLAGSRPKTLPAAAVPVAVGTAVAVDGSLGWDGRIIWWRALCALLVALLLQIGTNYANDYSDGVRGTDDDRTGPLRLVGSGLVPARHVKIAAFAAFGLACVAGLLLAAAVGWELIIVGAASVAAGWFYTGGPNPYGYIGLGEVFVFVFFGLVATAGSTWVQIESLPRLAWLGGIVMGCLSCALLVTNNLRDIPTDRIAGKRTLAVRLGEQRSRVMYTALIVGAFGGSALMAIDRPWSLLALLAAPLALTPVRTVLGGADGRALIPVLADTGRLQLVLGVLLTVGLWLSA